MALSVLATRRQRTCVLRIINGLNLVCTLYFFSKHFTSYFNMSDNQLSIQAIEMDRNLKKVRLGYHLLEIKVKPDIGCLYSLLKIINSLFYLFILRQGLKKNRRNDNIDTNKYWDGYYWSKITVNVWIQTWRWSWDIYGNSYLY